MAAAAILSLEEFRDRQGRAAIRQRLHDRFDRWLQRVEAHVKEPQPTLAELTQAVLALRQALTPAVTESLGEQTPRVALDQRTAVCPPCGQALTARGPQERTVETLGGTMAPTPLFLLGALSAWVCAPGCDAGADGAPQATCHAEGGRAVDSGSAV